MTQKIICCIINMVVKLQRLWLLHFLQYYCALSVIIALLLKDDLTQRSKCFGGVSA